MYEELIHKEQKEGFEIKFYACEEIMSLEDSFDYTDEEMSKLLQDIDRGNLCWFMAKVTASKEGVELATEYLGTCCYKSALEFISDDYYQDMVHTVIKEAKAKIVKLVA